MKRIVIFGDSYSAANVPPFFPWSRIISDTGKYEIINFAVNGSSTEYSLRTFIKFLKDGSLRADDVIIFQLSTIGRLDFMHQELYPNTAAQYCGDLGHSKDDNHSWYHDNKEYIKWYIVNKNYETQQLQQTSYLHLLKSFAEHNKSNTLILLKNSDQHDYTIPFDSYPDNMFVPNVDLYQISINESGYDHWEFTKYTQHQDLRENHLSLVNRKKLAELIIEIIENKTIENFTTDSFAKNILQPIKSKHHYEQYVSLGLLEARHIKDSWFVK